jgi:hypothetical protein
VLPSGLATALCARQHANERPLADLLEAVHLHRFPTADEKVSKNFGLAIGWLEPYIISIIDRKKASVTERPYRAPAAQQEGAHEFDHLSIAFSAKVRAPLGF